MLARRFLTFVFLIGLSGSGVVGCGGNDLAGLGEVGAQDDAELPGVLGAIIDSTGVPALGAIAFEATVGSGVQVRDTAVAGVRARGSTNPVRLDDLWHIGSLTKAMTATLAARLVERGVLGWGTTVGGVFPDFVGVIRDEYEDVRLDELMYHTSRLPVDITVTPSWPDPSHRPDTRYGTTKTLGI